MVLVWGDLHERYRSEGIMDSSPMVSTFEARQCVAGLAYLHEGLQGPLCDDEAQVRME